MPQLVYKRVLLKLSGEAFGAVGQGINVRKLHLIVREIRALIRLGVELGIVIGAGNWWRRRNNGRGFDNIAADYMGIVATLLNALALQQSLKQSTIRNIIQSYVGSEINLVQKINKKQALDALRQGQVIIFAGGTGRPFFTTDTAAARQASMIQADVLIKAGPVDGVYDADPNKYKPAQKFSELTIKQALRLNLGVIDKAAFRWCEKYKIPIIVCKWQKGAVSRAVKGFSVGTIVKP